MATKTTKTNFNRSNYITNDNETGKYALMHLKNTCEEALIYCQENGVEAFEDFAEQVEIISQEKAKRKGEIAVIKAEVKGNGLVLSMPNLSSATTTGKMMMKHLGFDEAEQNRFTKQGVESIINPDREEYLDSLKSLSDLDDSSSFETQKNNFLSEDIDEFDDFEEDRKTTKQKTNYYDLDDLDFSENSQSNNKDKIKNIESAKDNKSQQERPNNTNSKNSQEKIKSKSKVDSLASLVGAINDGGEALTERGENIDGLSMMGLGLQTKSLIGAGILNLLKNSKNREDKMLAKTIERLEKDLERADRVQKRMSDLESEDLSTENETERSQQVIDDFEDEDLSEKPQQINKQKVVDRVTDAVNQIDRQISKAEKKPSQKIEIDRNESIEKQLKQINDALTKLEKRLDEMESRLTILERSILTKNREQESESIQFAENIDKATIYFDGAAKGNPGIAAGAAVVEDNRGDRYIVSQPLEKGTNNQAEYAGLIVGLQKAKELGIKEVQIKGDSQLIVNQLNGKASANKLKEQYEKAKSLLNDFEKVSVEWIPREDNHLADRAANDCITEYLKEKSTQATQTETVDSQKRSLQFAEGMLEAYQLREKLDRANGQKPTGGIEITENIEFYVYKGANSTTITLEETEEFNEIFSATKQEGEWQIDVDELDNEQKRILIEALNRDRENSQKILDGKRVNCSKKENEL
jgi:ribonuclease HI